MYLAVPQFEYGKLVGYEVKQKVSRPMRPKGNFDILFGVYTEFPMAVLIDGAWTVVEDPNKKSRIVEKPDPKQLLSKIDEAKNFDDLKLILKSILEHIIR